MIELDVLPRRDGSLIIAHDHRDARRRPALSLDEAIEAFASPPLDGVEIDFDLKVAAGERQLARAIEAGELLERAMVSTMELSSLRVLASEEPRLRLGWTYPKVGRDWSRIIWARPVVGASLLYMRRRLPAIAARAIPRLGVRAMWVYHPLVTSRLIATADRAGIEVIAWTVDDPERMRALRALGVHGICTNDPRLFARLGSDVRPDLLDSR